MLDQITENEQERLFELERKDQENIQMQRQVEKMMDEDRVQLEKKKVEQESLRVGKKLHYGAVLDIQNMSSLKRLMTLLMKKIYAPWKNSYV